MDYIIDKHAFNLYLYHNCHCVNAGQTPEERRSKYKFCRLLGDDVSNAIRRRDWTYDHIAKVHGYTDARTMVKLLTGG